ncbi:hypothetical protein GGX14DRAFT_406008 [Mycena pura]|uniref:Uncharacterized protein n=1 Tax=Mycena pura TaxID=153505 RepID=A0AAD6USQ1_9AGAR|nr:hypothetical protein GGX14DRAFT_406008 [Mycena pura]
MYASVPPGFRSLTRRQEHEVRVPTTPPLGLTFSPMNTGPGTEPECAMAIMLEATFGRVLRTGKLEETLNFGCCTMPLKIGPGKVGQQFSDTLATIRDEAHRTLHARAIDWLKAARYMVMRQLEASPVAAAATNLACRGRNFSSDGAGRVQVGCKPVADAFSATNIGGIVDVRSESSSAPRGNPSGSRKWPRVVSPAVEEGSDAGGSRRLRSTTSASSSATGGRNMRLREE